MINNVETVPAFGYLKDVINLATAMIECPNVLAYEVSQIDTEMVGGRYSGKTLQALCCVIEASYTNLNISTNIYRYEPKGAEETFYELLNVYEDKYDQITNRLNCNLSKKRLQIRNNHIRAIGLLSNRKKSTPKLGLYRRGIKKDIQINVFEEANEFENEKMIKLMQQASGGAKVVINIFIANPWYLGNWFISRVAKFVGFNETLLKTKGEVFKQHLDIPEKKLRIGHITNHRINNFLSDRQHRELTDLWQLSEYLARVADWGMYGVAEGMIFAPIMHKIVSGSHMLRAIKFEGGLDWGVATGENASATSLTLGRRGDAWISFDDEYYHSNRDMYYKSDDQILEEIAFKIKEFYDIWHDFIEETYSKTLTIAIDYGAMALETALRRTIKAVLPYKYHERISLVPAYKIEIPIRIQIFSFLITNGKMFINKEKCKFAWQYLEEAQWDPSKKVSGQPTMLDKNKDTFDAQWYQFSNDYDSIVDKRLQKYHKYV